MSSKGKDISTLYAKYKKKYCGRKGYVEENGTVISPKDYGMFMQGRKVKKK